MSFSADVPSEYSQACDYLQQARKFGAKLGLETMRRLAELLGHPEAGLAFIHIAGTNGKGSTAAFCDSALQAAGLRVGLFTSPHLCSLRERIRINGQKISTADFAVGLLHIRRLALEAGLQPTFFELLTALALWYFHREQVDWVVWETGLGGRLDSTNIVTPRVSVISNIALDHQEFLGSTRAQIAAEKAGIIKSGVPVVTGVIEAESGQVIEAKARESSSPLVRVGTDLPVEILAALPESLHVRLDGREFSLGLAGAHQARNAGCALAALSAAGVLGSKVTMDHLQLGFARTTWPGRFQTLSREPLIIVDGAHNVDAVLALESTWTQIYPDQPYHLVFGALSDKPYAEMAAILSRRALRVTLVGVPSERSATPEQLRPHFSVGPVDLSPDLSVLWPSLVQAPNPVLIAGSLFLVGQALMLAQPQEYPPEDWALNERLR